MQIGIIGTGLIGSSLARAFHDKNVGTVHVFDRDPVQLDAARLLGFADQYHDDVTKLAAASDIVIICVPVSAIASVAGGIAPHMRAGTIISDVGSVKDAVVQQVRAALPQGVVFVPGHPAAGSDKSGAASGFASLFDGKVYVLTPEADTDAKAVKIIDTLISATGARVVYMDPTTHDRVFAFTSHLPHLLAFAAMHAVPKISERASCDILPYAGVSFHEWTRIGASDPVMWRDIFRLNAKDIQASLKIYMAELNNLSQLIENDDADGLKSYIEQSRAARLSVNAKLGEKE